MASAFVLLLLLAQPTSAEWPQWRGPDRDGRAPAAPAAWPDSLRLVWKVPVGEGHASPVVVGDRVYVHSRVDDREVATGLDLATGRTLWHEGRAVAYKMNPAAYDHGKGPKSTPVVAGDRLYTLGVTGVLAARDRRDGALQWRRDFAGEFAPSAPLYGTATSPLLRDELLIAWVGGHDDGALVAVDAESGETRWRWDGDGPGYTSPILLTVDGVEHLVTQSQRFNLGFDPDTGALRWQTPYRTDYDQNSVTPVAYQGAAAPLVIFSGIDKGIAAVRLDGAGGAWHPTATWHNSDLSLYMSSPVLDGHLLYGHSHKKLGQYFCLDARSGQALWTSPGRQGEHASVVAAGDWLLLTNTEAELIVAAKGGQAFAPHRRYTIADGPTWAHPAVLDGRLLVKDFDHLYLWSLE